VEPVQPDLAVYQALQEQQAFRVLLEFSGPSECQEPQDQPDQRDRVVQQEALELQEHPVHLEWRDRQVLQGRRVSPEAAG